MFERPFGNCVCNIFLSFSRNRLAQWFKQCHAIQLFHAKNMNGWMNLLLILKKTRFMVEAMPRDQTLCHGKNYEWTNDLRFLLFVKSCSQNSVSWSKFIHDKMRNECITLFFPTWNYCNGKILDRYGNHLKDVQNRGR